MKAMKKEKLFTRNFTLLILGQVSSLTGNYTLKFALSMYVLEQTGSASIFAGMLSAALLPTVLLSPFGGILADRANRKHIMVALDALSGLSVLAAGLLLGAASLRRKGFLTAARWCAAVGLVGLVCEMACSVLWRRSE